MTGRKGLEYKYIVALVSVFGLFMELLDATIVNVAIPTLSKEFNASTTQIEWVVTGYLLSLGVFIPVSGWAGDRFGTKRTFMFALTTFTTASLLCATSQNIEWLIAFRFLQGVGGGMLTPVGTAMVFRAFPPHERSKASGLMVIPTTVAPASGPVLGGFLVEYVRWEWIFLVNIPVGLLGLFVSWRFLKEHKEPSPGKLDVPGFVLAAGGLGSILYALAEAGSRGWTSGTVMGFGFGGMVLLAVFSFVELRTKQPMLDVRLFANRLFRACNTAQFVGMLGFSASLFLLPIFLQAQRGLSPFESGLTTFPMALGVMSAAQPISRVYRHIGPRRLIMGGLVISSLTSFGLAYINYDTSLWTIRGLMYVRGLGFGLMLVPLQAATFSSITPAMTGRASSIFSSSRMVAQSLGVAIIATVLTNRLVHHGARLGFPGTREGALSAFHDGFIVAGIMTLVGVAVAILIRDRDAAASMAPRVRAVGAAAAEERERQAAPTH